MFTASNESPISDFDGKRSLYLDFSDRVESMITTLIRDAGIRVDSIRSRTKTVESLREKLRRKSYAHLEDVPDLVGLRVIAYDREGADRVVELIRDEFDVDDEESGDTAETLGPTEFGYSSVHLVIRLSEGRRQLPEWSQVKALRAEVQVRTVLQHAWASISHALQYKHEDEVPRALRRRLARVSALLELADQEFAALNREHNELKASSDPETTDILMVVRMALGRRRHSYQWIRDKTGLSLTDKEFDELAAKHPETLHQVRIIHRDESGNKVPGGRPGLKVKETETDDRDEGRKREDEKGDTSNY
jgi:ppGpp synthetase/RelA/SpoT-type nucleotidyltranferase